MKNYIYQNTLISKKQLRQLLAWSFTNYDSMQACALADELKYLGFNYATKAGISISIEDLKVPFIKTLVLEKANQEILSSEKMYLKGKITEVERFQKIIDTWSLTSESLKDQIIYYFKNYDPLNSVYIMAFSGARGNLSQVRQLVGMRGLMADPSGQLMNLPIKKNFREGLTITDYLISGYGARKGIVDTALKTANSGYLTRRLIDVAQDILIREKDCLTTDGFIFSVSKKISQNSDLIYKKSLGRILHTSIFDSEKKILITKKNTQITPSVINKFKKKRVLKFHVRSPLVCNLYRAICQKCYGWDLTSENLVDIGEAIGILAGQSIGEPGTQLTMRTFHTGGIFTTEARQQIISPLNGIIKFHKFLKTVKLRTNRGEAVLVTKNSGSVVLVSDNSNKQVISIEILKNTILFCKNNHYILKDMVIGELINKNKELKTEIKPILSDKCGEIFIPSLKQNINVRNNNKLIWILSGQLYNSPLNSFLNFGRDYKVNKSSYIFRTKIMNHYTGFVNSINNKKNLTQRFVKLENIKYVLSNATLKHLNKPIFFNNYLLEINKLKYLIRLKNFHVYNSLQLSSTNKFGTLLTNVFKTFTGGTIYYDYPSILPNNKKEMDHVLPGSDFKNYESLSNYRTIIWLGEEFYRVTCEKNKKKSLVEDGDFISKGFELIPGIFSKTSGLVSLVSLTKKNKSIEMISIKSGLVYEAKNFKNFSKKLYYPGEILFEKIIGSTLTFCEQIIGKPMNKILLRPIEIYEVPYHNLVSKNSIKHSKSSQVFKLKSKSVYCYKSNQIIKSKKNLDLVSNILIFRKPQILSKNIKIGLSTNFKKDLISFTIHEQLSLINFISPNLRYKNLSSCFLIQKNQFLSSYMILGYLEGLTSDYLEIVKVKIKEQTIKEIFVISNKDCLMIEKKEIPNKKLNDFITSPSNLSKTGKIILENKNIFTIQSGRPYFFPNCNHENQIAKTPLEYKVIPSSRLRSLSLVNTSKNVKLNYYNIFKLSINQRFKKNRVCYKKSNLKAEFSKLFIKNNGKLFSCLIPQFFKKFSVNSEKLDLKVQSLLRFTKMDQLPFKKMKRTLLINSSNLKMNKDKSSNKGKFASQLTLVKFVEQSFLKSKKSIGLYSITENYFEQDMNEVFCTNNEFIEAGKTIGLLNLEKEITGDIVQGLPRIEEILEARKKNITIKRIPISKKKGLLIQKSSLDTSFEFKKLATTIKENDKVNPHKLLKSYFNYYGLVKYFLCDQSQKFKFNRLVNNYEGTYKSFKKVQIFILNSIQSVYQSQGVTINDKHLEVIIKQMTTKVLITSEGDTPLLQREAIDLYHIQYMNEILDIEMKEKAYYVPLLLGITKASLNNPSFISAASFQETTRVLTKAAIEGKIDWLRGLKENIILGNLIPAGTGSRNYRHCCDPSVREKNSKYNISELTEGSSNL